MKALVKIPYGRALLVPESHAASIAEAIAHSEVVKEDGWGDTRKLLYPARPDSITVELLPPSMAVVDAEIEISPTPPDKPADEPSF